MRCLHAIDTSTSMQALVEYDIEVVRQLTEERFGVTIPGAEFARWHVDWMPRTNCKTFYRHVYRDRVYDLSSAR